MPKQEAHAIVASFDSQYWQCDESDEIAAPQFGQLRVSACISVAQPALLQLNIPQTVPNGKVLDGGGLSCNPDSGVEPNRAVNQPNRNPTSSDKKTSEFV